MRTALKSTFFQLRPRGCRDLRSAGNGSERGFTLLELIVVVAIVGILAAIAVPSLIERPKRAREAVLRNNLFAIRDVLDQYYGDKGHYPESLDSLVEAGYFRLIPMDPITESRDTWITEYEEVDLDNLPAESDLPEGGGPGIIDVHSGSEEISLDGVPYAEW